MENRFQYVFLIFVIVAFGFSHRIMADINLPVVSEPGTDKLAMQSSSAKSINTEFFELGLYTGVLNIQDFNSEAVLGARATFHASEDFFLQFDYGAAEAELSSYEKSQGKLIADEDRDYSYYEFLLGYKVFTGEVFPYAKTASLSTLNLVAGVGNTQFGGEENFTFTLGLGYQVAVLKGLSWSVDFRDHFYQSDLIQKKKTTHNIEFSSGLTYLF